MTGKRSTVDLGPMSLQLADPFNLTESPLVMAKSADVAKLDSLLREGGRRKSVAAEVEENLPLPDSNFQTFSVAVQDAAAVDALSETIAGVVPKISHSLKPQSVSEVEIRLREALLPKTTLTARDVGGNLVFELCVGDADKRIWLVQKLPILVQQVGQRLNRPMQVTVFDPAQRNEPLATCTWPLEVPV